MASGVTTLSSLIVAISRRERARASGGDGDDDDAKVIISEEYEKGLCRCLRYLLLYIFGLLGVWCLLGVLGT